MDSPPIIQTIGGINGFETCYVSFKDLIDKDGALVETPTVTSQRTDLIQISGVSLDFAGTINGVLYDVGDVLSFIATAVSSYSFLVPVHIEYETPKRRETVRVFVKLKEWSS